MQLHNLYYFISQSCSDYAAISSLRIKNSHTKILQVNKWAICGWFAQFIAQYFCCSTSIGHSRLPIEKHIRQEEKIYKLSFSLRSFKLILHGSKIQSSSGCLQSLHLRWVAAQKWPIYSALCSRKKTSLMLCCVFDDNNPNNLTANRLCKKKNAFYFLKFSPASLNHRRSADSSATDAWMSIATRLAAFSYLAMPRMSTEKISGLRPISFFTFFSPRQTHSLSLARSVARRHRRTQKSWHFVFIPIRRLPSREMCELRSRIAHIREKKLWFVVRLCVPLEKSAFRVQIPSPRVYLCVCVSADELAHLAN